MKTRIIIVCLLTLVAVIGLKIFTYANESIFYKEINFIGGYSSRDGWVDKSPEQVSSVGFEDYRRFSGDYGDYLTTDLQMRIAYDSTRSANDAWGLEVHNAWLLYKLGYGVKLRFGHFDPAFGLEPQLDTHGTILKTLAMKDIGFNKDWGFGLEGALWKFDYKTALQLGSGMSVYRKDGSLLLTARIGTPASGNLQYGLSLLYGRLLETMGMNTFPRNGLMSDQATLMKRVGLDSQYLFGPYLLKGEIAYGTNDHTNVLGYLGELDYTFPKYQNIGLEFQFQSWIDDLGKSSPDDSTLTMGASYKLSQSTTLRAAFSHDFNIRGQKEEDKFLVQLYFFGA